jgi:cytochrome c553
MSLSNILRKAALIVPFLGVVLVAYPAAPSSTNDSAQLGAQLVAQGTTKGAVACARCHGFDGAADGSGAFPKLAGQSPEYLAEQLRLYSSGERKNALMEPIAKGLSESEMKAVAQYYASARANAFVAQLQSSEVLARGEQLAKVGDLSIRVQACESCHGPNGTGLPPAVPYLAGQYRQYIALQIQMYKKGFRKNEQMKDPAQNLRDQDIAAVAAYFEQVSRSSSK